MENEQEWRRDKLHFKIALGELGHHKKCFTRNILEIIQSSIIGILSIVGKKARLSGSEVRLVVIG